MRFVFAALLGLIGAALAPALPAQAQSWCGASGLNPTEQTICGDSILGRMDDQLGDLYRQVRAQPGLREDQAAWLRTRNICGRDILCIEQAYTVRIRSLNEVASGTAHAATPLRRPWCKAARLNATERAICSFDALANLDAAMTAVYGAAKAQASDAAQVDWLRNRRNACGAEVECIMRAYLIRIEELGARLRGF